jgi:hypothetical protein
MSYSFNPIPDVPVDHKGFGIILAFAIIWLVIVLLNEPETFFVYFFLCTIPTGIAYGVSYHWTNQEPKTFANIKVEGKFVGYESEGYKERSGKSYVDRHFTYVIYKVEGGNVMLPCVVGIPYPETAILYKN